MNEFLCNITNGMTVNDQALDAFMIYIQQILENILIASAVVVGLSVIFWVFQSIGTCGIAKKRKVKAYGVAWLPVIGWHYVIGGITDSLKLEKSQKKTHFKLDLPVLIIGYIVVTVLFSIMFVNTVTKYGLSLVKYQPGIYITAILSILLGIALLIFQYIALYNIYKVTSKTPVLLIVLSIIFTVCIPFFLFFNRKNCNEAPDIIPETEDNKQTVQPENAETENNTVVVDIPQPTAQMAIIDELKNIYNSPEEYKINASGLENAEAIIKPADENNGGIELTANNTLLSDNTPASQENNSDIADILFNDYEKSAEENRSDMSDTRASETAGIADFLFADYEQTINENTPVSESADNVLTSDTGIPAAQNTEEAKDVFVFKTLNGNDYVSTGDETPYGEFNDDEISSEPVTENIQTEQLVNTDIGLADAMSEQTEVTVAAGISETVIENNHTELEINADVKTTQPVSGPVAEEKPAAFSRPSSGFFKSRFGGFSDEEAKTTEEKDNSVNVHISSENEKSAVLKNIFAGTIAGTNRFNTVEKAEETVRVPEILPEAQEDANTISDNMFTFVDIDNGDTEKKEKIDIIPEATEEKLPESETHAEPKPVKTFKFNANRFS